MAIYFSTLYTPFSLPNTATITKWICEVAKRNQKRVAALNYIFCNDTYLHQINLKHLQHDTLTDIITFDYSEESSLLIADFYISIPRVAENAPQFDVPFPEELARVMIHGLLHLIGYSDKTPTAKERMRKQENKYLAMPIIQQWIATYPTLSPLLN